MTSTTRTRTRAQVATGLGAIGIATAVGLTGTVSPASAAVGDPHPAANGSVPFEPRPADGTYTVGAGDTLYDIAARYEVTVAAILAANDLGSRTIIQIGQELRIPEPGSSGSSSSGGSSSSSSGSSSSDTGSSTYTVRTGDTLYGIAARHDTTVADLMSANSLTSTVIRPGQTLTIGGSGGSSTSADDDEEQLVPSTFLGYTYPDSVVSSANENKRTLLSMDVPSAAQMQEIIRTTANRMGVDPALALAIAYQESGFDARAVSPANAIGVMQVIPSSGEWASDMVGEDLNLLDPRDNVVAGIAILRYLIRTAPDLPTAIAGYYQGLGSVTRNGMYADTRRYVANVQTLMTRYE